MMSGLKDGKGVEGAKAAKVAEEDEELGLYCLMDMFVQFDV